ncbi:uncharacterized protein N7483_010433 [Penicillium malachiteum]|uniref:uncharacterized protein n=1 Tax=Penicillium malachiteum TaxID=1324776 RepID=UPI0025498F0F|nr:uncharacterized protein N7483_010433 [Penicillium malachiteum]KAJ5713252.1 hypothetical protein N7483_010433 [Penicillium malachiteum]
MSTDDLKAHAASDQDFYALLDISPAATESEIRRAYRRTALKYHPDKIANPTQADIDKFHNLQIANDILSNTELKQLYDNTREARLRKQRERDQLDSARRQMVEDLERREREGAEKLRGVKRSWAASKDADAKLAAEMERCAEDGRRRRREAAEKLQRERDEELRALEREEEEARKAADRSAQVVDRSQEKNVDELDRSVKVLWEREGRGQDLDVDWLKGMFVRFGKIEGAFILKDKRKRVEGKKGKVTIATGVLVYESIVSAHAAVLDSEKMIRQAGDDWSLIESVIWASGKGPDLGPTTFSPAPAASTETAPYTTTKDTPKPSTAPKFSFSAASSVLKSGSGKAPSFGSFASAATSMDSSSGASAKPANGPSFTWQEQVQMRMNAAQREKERKALEEELAREDEAADAEALKQTNGS